MKKLINLKKIICAVVLLIWLSSHVKAQSNEPFEGELAFETFENYSDGLLNVFCSIDFNGVHKVRLILKGEKMHLIDETTKCHIIADNSIPSCVHFCDLTKTGMDYEGNIGGIKSLFKGNIEMNGRSYPITTYTYAPTETKKNIMGKDCILYQGDINREVEGMEQKYVVKTYMSDIVAPAGYKWYMYCLDAPRIALKYSYKYDGGHIGNVGELSKYYEADVTKITPRKVADDEFNVPNGYKISKCANQPYNVVKYFKSVKKQLEKLGIKGESNDKKTTGVHYKTDDEWSF